MDPGIGPDALWCAIEIVDNDIGIVSQYFERMSSLFERLHSMREYEGTSIGLANCRWIVGQHGGTTGIASVQDGGTMFNVRLPVPQVEAEARR